MFAGVPQQIFQLGENAALFFSVLSVLFPQDGRGQRVENLQPGLLDDNDFVLAKRFAEQERAVPIDHAKILYSNVKCYKIKNETKVGKEKEGDGRKHQQKIS